MTLCKSQCLSQSLLTVCLFAIALAAAVAWSPAQAAEPALGDPTPKTFLGDAAKKIIASLKEGEGWSVVSSRGKQEILPGAGAQDCVKYSVVKKYRMRKTDDGELVVDVEYYPETDWIAAQWRVPTTSGPSLAAAKAANAAIVLVDMTIAFTESVEAKGDDARLKPLIIAALKSQRAAMVTLIMQDVAQLGER